MSWNLDRKILNVLLQNLKHMEYFEICILKLARRTGSDGSMSASGSAGPGFDPRQGSKF